ncbi:hypothetical protein E2C01_067075 [Portunus trituberculatus]|uniref:Uncharacterized protein n=1 Tax=Portunus trituberculatus TaxID=210409 RepID=A0A5B7HN64_PORTR|nr:hypothetical protein [Portunus trituberculatus]
MRALGSEHGFESCPRSEYSRILTRVNLILHGAIFNVAETTVDDLFSIFVSPRSRCPILLILLTTLTEVSARDVGFSYLCVFELLSHNFPVVLCFLMGV